MSKTAATSKRAHEESSSPPTPEGEYTVLDIVNCTINKSHNSYIYYVMWKPPKDQHRRQECGDLQSWEPWEHVSGLVDDLKAKRDECTRLCKQKLVSYLPKSPLKKGKGKNISLVPNLDLLAHPIPEKGDYDIRTVMAGVEPKVMETYFAAARRLDTAKVPPVEIAGRSATPKSAAIKPIRSEPYQTSPRPNISDTPSRNVETKTPLRAVDESSARVSMHESANGADMSWQTLRSGVTNGNIYVSRMRLSPGFPVGKARVYFKDRKTGNLVKTTTMDDVEQNVTGDCCMCHFFKARVMADNKPKPSPSPNNKDGVAEPSPNIASARK